MIETLQALRQHQLVILRRLRGGPLTEFELVREVAGSSSYPMERCAESMPEWLEELRQEGLIWAGFLTNAEDQRLLAAALTKKGRQLVA